MLRAYAVTDALLKTFDWTSDPATFGRATWIDLLEPTEAEEGAVEHAFGIDVPTRDDMRAIDASSQVYREGEALIMTARIVSRHGRAALRLVDVTFILIHNTLITLRYGDPKPFQIFAARCAKETGHLASGDAVMVGLLEAVVDRAAEILQTITDDLEDLSVNIFDSEDANAASGPPAELRPLLQTIGRNGDLATRVRESLQSIGRLIPSIRAAEIGRAPDDLPGRIEILAKDIVSLMDHSNYLLSNVTFLLDATLGLINIQQNVIIKIFSVVSIVFMPPTLIAGIYGMNFAIIPELKWDFGYPYALVLMLLSAVLPLWYFRAKRWL